MKHKKYNLDPFTFGDSLAAQNLSKIINEKSPQKGIKNLMTAISESHKLLNDCDNIINNKSRQRILNLVRKYINSETINKINIDNIFKSHARSLLHAKYKSILIK